MVSTGQSASVELEREGRVASGSDVEEASGSKALEVKAIMSERERA